MTWRVNGQWTFMKWHQSNPKQEKMCGKIHMWRVLIDKLWSWTSHQQKIFHSDMAKHISYTFSSQRRNQHGRKSTSNM